MFNLRHILTKKMNLVPRYDDPKPKTLKVIGQTRFFLKCQ